MLYQSNIFREDMKPSYAVNSNRPSSFRKLVNSKYSINRSGLKYKKLMVYRRGSRKKCLLAGLEVWGMFSSLR